MIHVREGGRLDHLPPSEVWLFGCVNENYSPSGYIWQDKISVRLDNSEKKRNENEDKIWLKHLPLVR